MKHWTLKTIMVETNLVKVYVNGDCTRAVVFPPYGRYYSIASDVNALDLATSLLFHVTVNDKCYNIITYSSYINSLDDTAIIETDKVA